MLLACLFLTLSVVAGWQVVRLLPLRAHHLEAAAMSVALGFNLAAWLTFVLSLLFGAVLGLGLALGGLGLLAALQLAVPRRLSLTSAYYHRNWRPIAVFATLFIVATILLLVDLTFSLDTATWDTNGFTWGDLTVHTAFITQFAHGARVDLTSPLYLKMPLTYPFLPDYFSGTLLRLSGNWRLALELPTQLMMLATLQLIWSVGLRLTKTVRGAWTAFLLLVYSGSMYGGVVLLIQTFIIGPHQLLHVDGINALFVSGSRYLNFIYAYLLPQHSFLFGFPLVLCATIVGQQLWRQDGPATSKREGLYLGVVMGACIGLLPLIHDHSFLVAAGLLGLATAIQLVWRRSLTRGWIVMLLLAVGLAIPQLAYQFYNSAGTHFTHFILGWQMYYRQIETNSAWLMHWLTNLGFGLVFMVLGWFWLRRQSASAELWCFYVASIAVFVVANLVVFQPAYYDNMKFFIYSFWLLSLPLAFVLAQWSRSRTGAVLVGGLVLVMTLMGAMTLIFYGPALTVKYLTGAEVAFGNQLNRELPADAYLLVGDLSNSPVTSLANRKEMINMTDWVNLYDDNSMAVARDRQIMLAGGDTASSLIRRYGVTHAAFNDDEVRDGEANLAFYQRNYRLLKRQAGWWVFDLRRPL